MAWFQRFGVNVIDIVRMEDTGTTAIQNGLLARGIGKAETTPTVSLSVSPTRPERRPLTYLGCFVGAQTMAMLSGIMT
jgi:hypothetical protein